MIPILSADQIRALDKHTIEHEPVKSIDLMERACKAFSDWFQSHFPVEKSVGIACGTGNNGGDGLGIARLLSQAGYTVQVWIVRGDAGESEDFRKNLKRIPKKVPMAEIVSESDQGLFSQVDVLVDAVFGSGLSRPPDGIYAQVIRCINASRAVKVAVDIPSGLFADAPSPGPFVNADHTVTFQYPKLGFFLPSSGQAVGQWHRVDIGLDRAFADSLPCHHFLLTQDDVSGMVPPRKRFDHKGTYGKTLIIAGSYGKMGAAVLASRAALRSGTGLLFTYIPKCGYDILQTSVPEGMVVTDAEPEWISSVPDLSGYDSIGIGPGLGQNAATRIALRKLLENWGKPLVIDADALNILASNREMLHLLPPNSILTPHPGEFGRLAGEAMDDFDRLGKLKAFSASTKCIVVLKGAYSAVSFPDGRVIFNPTGNPGMATAGSGDVLTGVIAALLAQTNDPEKSALAGVYVHGLAGDLAARDKGEVGMVAGDIVETLPRAIGTVAGRQPA
jgi:NAD(P)H-hydrate epimerase